MCIAIGLNEYCGAVHCVFVFLLFYAGRCQILVNQFLIKFLARFI